MEVMSYDGDCIGKKKLLLKRAANKAIVGILQLRLNSILLALAQNLTIWSRLLPRSFGRESLTTVGIAKGTDFLKEFFLNIEFFPKKAKL